MGKSGLLVLDPTTFWVGLHRAVPAQTALNPNPPEGGVMGSGLEENGGVSF